MTDPDPSGATGDQAILERLRSTLAFVFDVPPATITPDTRLADLPQWSSLSFIVLMTAIENDFGRRPNRERAWEATMVGDLLSIIRDGESLPNGTA